MMADCLLTEIELAYEGAEELDVNGQETADLPLDMTSNHLLADMGHAYEGDEELDANGQAISDSDPQDMISDRLLTEMELAHERDEDFTASGQASGDLSMATIAYEEAIERELEYQKRMNMSSLQPPVFVSTPFRQQNASRQQPLGQGQQCRQPQPHLSMSQRPLQHWHPPFWCNICKLNCESFANLKVHCRGRKHRAKLEEIRTGKTKIPVPKSEMLWCKECNIPCTTEMALAQHRAGKKHMTTVALRAYVGAPGAGMNDLQWMKNLNK